MTYVLSLIVPIAYEANDDDDARVMAEHVEDVLLGTTLPHSAEILDAPGYVLEESLPYTPLRMVVAQNDAVARYAPFPADTGAGHSEPCPECLDYIAASRTPAAGDIGLVVEIQEEDDQPGGTRPAGSGT